MKFVLINCYADHNKGDLGIIESTIGLIKKAKPNAEISAISTYNADDPCFLSEHHLLKKLVHVYPSIFGELNIRQYKNIFAKYIRFICDTLRLIIFLILPIYAINFSRYIFTKCERVTLDELQSADVIISKGGSFLCNEGDIRSRIALFRFLYIFFVCIKLKKRILILAQSIGPISGLIDRIVLNLVLRKCEKIVLRENLCLNEYSYLNIPTPLVINDIAYIDASDNSFAPFVLNGEFKIGITIKFTEDHLNEAYCNMMISFIEYIIKKFNANVYIFPHVTIENDIGNAINIYKKIKDEYKFKISIFSGDYTPGELKKLYMQMDYFVGTRLHSTIFAMSQFVPCICISYHGTKSRGIFSNFGLSQYAIEKYDPFVLIESFNMLIQNRTSVIQAMKSTINKDESDFIGLIRSL